MIIYSLRCRLGFRLAVLHVLQLRPCQELCRMFQQFKQLSVFLKIEFNRDFADNNTGFEAVS